MTAKTRYILDTNVLLFDPEALLAFPDGEVIVPITAIEEIDQFKAEVSETGRNARLVSNTIDQYRQAGSLADGVRQPNGSTIRVQVWSMDDKASTHNLDMRKSGNRVLATALQLARENKAKTILISQDTNLRIKANALGIEAIGYDGDRPVTTEIHTGFQLFQVSAREVEAQRGRETLQLEGKFYPNEGAIFQDAQNPGDYCVFRYHAKKKHFTPVQIFDEDIWEIAPRNPQQALALDLLLDPGVSIITLMGKAGTGKTLLALAAGLRMMLDENTYTKMLVSRPIFPMGKDIGYLPGTAEQKLEPWMQPIFDNLEFLIGSPVSKHHPAKGYQALLDQGLINIEPLTYIRGRSIPHQFMIVDEAQNLTPHEIKTIITRVGEGTKIILTGDAYQIDNPYVDSISNGLSNVVERFKDLPLAGHVTLMRGERSSLAEMAANVL
ncbi:MAG: PhoH family protein [SAR324 cluster bacterium]|nr:PhoH family protein [SAR324 cluster bacterium]